MVLRVADRLSTERRRRLVGRLPERELFQGAMRAPALPFQLLYVYGPGGVGKTTLLREFASLCDEAGTPACYVDARDVEPAPASFVHALSTALGLERSAHPDEYLAARRGRYVLLIDTYETLAPLHGWLRGLSLIESGRLGLFPHDLAREALAADVRWRNPDWYPELHRRARNYYTTRVQQVGEQEQQRLLFDLIFLHRDNPVMRPFFEWQESGGLLAEVPQEQDWPALRDADLLDLPFSTY